MDASESMQWPAFAFSPAKKEELVAGCVSGGIFELEEMESNGKSKAYVCGIMFDTETKLIFMDTVADLLKAYSRPGDFADYLKSQFSQMHKRTDINKALQLAKCRI